VIEDIIHIIFISLYTDYSIFEKLPLWKCSHLTCLYIIEATTTPTLPSQKLGCRATNLSSIDAYMYVKRNEWQRNWINRSCRNGSVRMMSSWSKGSGSKSN